ncbi:related to aldehyde reductase II [Serendipita indica DSM 11827]|uniref:Related to aldehyde reductase II n=1 Tax=Serendipita indica (strain DSM 11827) TaxID=1109443 RepID=G4T8T2_SERID|nr:related to aldehyde reductase II [Serendipita indica DSM 11827]
MGKVLLTGASGFIAATVLRAYLKAGHTVRFTVRSDDKAQQIVANNPEFTSLLEAAIVPDIAAKGAYDEALRDDSLDAVVHTASPFFTDVTDPQLLLRPAVEGTLNLLHAVAKFAPRVKRVIITSSFAAMINESKGNWPGHEYNEDDWNPITDQQALSGGIVTYRASKTFAERAAWNFVADKKPSFDLVTLNPPMVYGPIINTQRLSALNESSQRFWKFLSGQMKEIPTSSSPLWVDVRDVAAAHLAAYEKPAAGGKRFFIVADEWYSNQDIADIFRKHFPEVRDKVPEGTPGRGFHLKPEEIYTHNNSRSKEILGITYRSFETCATDAGRSILELAKAENAL